MPIGRSWTDPYSNHTSIAGIDVSGKLQELLGVGDMPDEVLLSLMHEATHHWTFNSPVGFTVALLNAQSRRHALQIMDGQDQHLGLLQSYLGRTLTTEMLRPLAEGIALSAEFDAINRKSKFISGPFLAVARAFAAPDLSVDSELFAIPADGELIRARRSAKGVDRKLTVFADRLHGSESGYLLGYLSMRSMMRTLWRAWSTLIEEGDLCISYIRAYMYSDLELVELLMTPSDGELEYVQSLRSHMSDRLWNLDQVTEADIREYEELAATDTAEWSTDYSKCLHYSAAKAAVATERAQALAEEVVIPVHVAATALQDHAELLAVLDHASLSGRSVVYLGSADVDIEIHDGHCDVNRDGTALLRDLPTESADGSRHGELDVYYDTGTATSPRIVHLTAPETIALVTEGPPWTALTDDGFRPFLSRAQTRTAVSAFDTAVHNAVTTGWLPIAVDHFLNQLPAVVVGLYQDVAVRFVASDDLETTIAALADSGIKGLLDGDRDLSEALVLAGTALQQGPLRAFVDVALNANGLEQGLFDELVEKSQTGLPLAWTHDGQAVTFV